MGTESIKNNICVLSVNLGGFDKPVEYTEQSTPHDFFMFTDENFPPRSKTMTPRLQAKIPKCFGWQMHPGYEYYMWIDGNLSMTNPDTLKVFLESCVDHDIVVIRHPGRTTIHWEKRYLERGLDQQSMYMINRYLGEHITDQVDAIKDDKDYVDDLLLLGGIFLYRNTPEVHAVLKEWWHHISRYLIMDQLSWVYVLKKSGLRVKILNMLYTDGVYFAHRGHRFKG